MTAYLRHPLDDCFERVARAGEHLIDLEHRMQQIRAHQANAIPLEFDPDPPHALRRAYPAETFYGMRMGVLVGEICYNLRSALDYLVFRLAELDSGAPQDGTQFPIEDTKKSFEWRRKRGWLNGVNTAHVAAIERLQPYAGCDWAKRLRDLSNPDKHRELVRHFGESDITVWFGWETDLARIAGLPRHATHPVRGIVEVKVHVALKVTFGDRTPVIEAIEEIKRGVAQALADFKPEF